MWSLQRGNPQLGGVSQIGSLCTPNLGTSPREASERLALTTAGLLSRRPEKLLGTAIPPLKAHAQIHSPQGPAQKEQLTSA